VPGHALRDAVELALDLGGGALRFLDPSGAETVLSLTRSCPSCRRDFEPSDPMDFSFNSKRGACPQCEGYGSRVTLDPERLIENWAEPFSRAPGGPLSFLDEPPFGRSDRRKLVRLLEAGGVDLDKSASELGPRKRAALLWGRGDYPGLIPFAEKRLALLEPEDADRFRMARGKEEPCPACGGSRLKREAAAVRVGDLAIHDLTRLDVGGALGKLARLDLSGRAAAVGRPVVEEVAGRLRFLEEVGLGYLTLDRPVATLSSGEAQRIRLAAQLGSNLRGACYILDEPTIGLHPAENRKLIEALRALRDRGNTVLVIEHDDATIAAADHLIEMGPGPGRKGGQVVAQGSLDDLMRCPEAPTGRYFQAKKGRRRSLSSRALPGPWIEIGGADLHNLRGIGARFPVGALTVVSGVSGAGKSTLVREVLKENVLGRLRGLRERPAGCRAIAGWETLRGVREVDQLPIGRTPRSTPATYVGFWSRIRSIFASTPEARLRGWGPARFSFNVKGGRCERCQGQGRIRMEMSFLPDVHIDCDRCRGDRYEPETLQVAYRGLSIGRVLRQTVEDARETFLNFPEVVRPLAVLEDLGLGYLTLGQPSTTLSGGEAERVKLAVELAKTTEGATLYVLDEPTIGLHLLEVERLVEVLRRLAAAGHAVVVIEHNLEVLAGAEWAIDLGPGGGDAGGQVLYQGPPAGLVAPGADSATAESLREFLQR
jgi:excinuclease ABC subunit A